jgi:hypothetical protein
MHEIWGPPSIYRQPSAEIKSVWKLFRPGATDAASPVERPVRQ